MIGDAGRHGIEPDIIQVVEAGKVGSLEPEGNLISADTTFYVATTGSDTTGDGSSGSPWATLRKALSYLDEYRILGSAKVTISIAKGKYTETSQVPVNHPNGDRIRIVGSTPLSRTMSSVQSVSGSSANYDKEQWL